MERIEVHLEMSRPWESTGNLARASSSSSSSSSSSLHNSAASAKSGRSSRPLKERISQKLLRVRRHRSLKRVQIDEPHKLLFCLTKTSSKSIIATVKVANKEGDETEEKRFATLRRAPKISPRSRTSPLNSPNLGNLASSPRSLRHVLLHRVGLRARSRDRRRNRRHDDQLEICDKTDRDESEQNQTNDDKVAAEEDQGQQSTETSLQEGKNFEMGNEVGSSFLAMESKGVEEEVVDFSSAFRVTNVRFSTPTVFKVLVIGDAGVGKTSFVNMYAHNSFSEDYRATVGVDFAMRLVALSENEFVKLQLWDIAGQERFTWMTRVYYRGARGCLIVFDISDRASFRNVVNWKRDLDNKCALPRGQPVPALLLANKCDLRERAVSIAEIEAVCQTYNFIGWTETSAKDNTMVRDSLKFLLDNMLLDMRREEEANEKPNVDVERKEGFQLPKESNASHTKQNNNAGFCNNLC